MEAADSCSPLYGHQPEPSPPLFAPYSEEEEGEEAAVEQEEEACRRDTEEDAAAIRLIATLPLESELDIEPLFDLSDMIYGAEAEERDRRGSTAAALPPPPPTPPRCSQRRAKRPRSYSEENEMLHTRRVTHAERAGLDVVALGARRPPTALPSSSKKCRRWTKEEDDALRACFSPESGTRLMTWAEIARSIGREYMQCLMRWRALRKDIRRGRWTAPEDERLRELVGIYGVHRWSAVGALMKTRTNKQCRERWLNVLSPDISYAPWTPCELRRLVDEVERRGRAWASLEKSFPGRTANDLKNKWNVMCGRRTKKRPRSEQVEEKAA